MKTSESIDKIIVAILGLQGDLKPVPRTKVVKIKSFEFRYAPLDAIFEYAIPLMQKYNLAFVQAVDESTINTRIMHESGQWIESNTFLNREHANMQGFGGEITYKRRYAFCSLLGIVSDDDVDAPRHRPTGDSFENLTPRRQNFIADLAEIIKEKAKDANEYGAYEEYSGVTDQEERIALWSLLPSDVRSMLKKLNEAEKKGI